MTIPIAFCASYPFMGLWAGVFPDHDLIPFPWNWRTVPLVAPLISAAVWFRFPCVRDEAVAFTGGVWALTVFFAYLFGGL
ncbi:hypothetical protein [Nocardia amikacinitolerans]|uniref:hypothetical protein n=1 Tax=Nocardia amikacinitolerans TaxID=756689 RepID=UPI0020A4AC74|nr:hypothetical protein [Nocardia amikacinitolerans]